MEEKVMDESKSTGYGDVPVHGVLVVEGVETGDRRRFAQDALTWRELPIPLLWQKASGDGHAGATVVGRIETIERNESGELSWSGFMNGTAEADEVTGLVADRSLRGVSVDVDDATMELQSRSGAALSEDVDIDPSDIVETLTKARISAATICAIPAFAEAYIALGSGEFRDVSQEERDKRASEGSAMSAREFSGDAVAARSVKEIVESLPVDAEIVEQLLAADEADLPDAVASVAESLEDPEAAGQVRAAADQIRDLLSPPPEEQMAGESIPGLPDLTPEEAERVSAAKPEEVPDVLEEIAEESGEGEKADQLRQAAKVMREANAQTEAPPEAASVDATEFGPTSNPTTMDGPGWLTHPVETDRLRDYWTHGIGAAKIGWGLPGDWSRCRALTAKYINPKHLNGYCANRHKDALGIWPGQHAVRSLAASPLVRSSGLLAAAAPALERAGVESVGFGQVVSVAADGSSGKSPAQVLLPGHRLKVLGVDARTYSAQVVEVQSFRDGAVCTLEGEDVSAGSLPASVAIPVQGSGPDHALAASADEGVEVRLVGEARLSGSHDSPVVALAHALAEPSRAAVSEEALTASGGIDIGSWRVHVPNVHAGEPVAPAYRLVASGGPDLPPMDWFANPGLQEPTPLTITEDGQVFGHVATWGTCHVGFEDSCVTAPTSTSEYAYFCSGVVATDGGDVRAGQITFDTGHAGLELNSRRTMAHYDNTGHCAADVMAGEDEVGIWVAGALRPGISDEQMRTLRGAKMSGDWRSIGGNLEMVAVLAVNVPGFPIPRPALAASGGRSEALVAAGVVPETKGVENFTVEEVVSATLAKIEADRAAREEIQRISAALAAEDIERTVSSVQMEG